MPRNKRENIKPREVKQRKESERKPKGKVNLDAIVEKKIQQLTGKTVLQLNLFQKHKLPVPRSVPTKPKQRLPFIMQMLDAKLPGTGNFKQRMMLLQPQAIEEFKNFKNEVIHMVFGTQEPEVRLYSTWQYVNTVAGGVLENAYYAIYWGGLQDNSSWAALFDEVKMINGVFKYIPVRWEVAADTPYYPSCGIVDYDDSGTVTFTNMLEYDTHKLFHHMLLAGMDKEKDWPWHSQGQPDLAWISTQATTTYVAWWKQNIVTAMDASATYGIVYFSAFVRFRQVI